MPYCIQYLNYEKLGRLPMPVEAGDYVVFGEGRGHTFTTQAFVERHRGSTVFLIVGIGKDPRRYYLWDCFIIDTVTRDGDIFAAAGLGFMLNPPQHLAGEHFDEFKEQCGGFSTFTDVSQFPYTATLRRLASRFHRPHANDETTRQFCEDLAHLIPEDSDAQDLLQICGD